MLQQNSKDYPVVWIITKNVEKYPCYQTTNALGVYEHYSSLTKTRKINHKLMTIKIDMDEVLENKEFEKLKDFGHIPIVYDLGTNILEDTQKLKKPYLDFFPFVDIGIFNAAIINIMTRSKSNASSINVEKTTKQLLSFGIKSVVIKDCTQNSIVTQDFWSDGKNQGWITSAKHNHHPLKLNKIFSTAVASAIAWELNPLDALVVAKGYINCYLREKVYSKTSLSSCWPIAPEDFPRLTQEAIIKTFSFKPCKEIGFYPIVNRSHWLEKLLPLGVKTIQLRIKDLKNDELESEIKRAIQLANFYNCQLFINDYWEFALKYKAYGVHLGQEDLEKTDLRQLENAGIRLGLSSHCYSEVARAHAIGPSYLAIGPIFSTKTKTMKFAPQGIEAFKMWRKMLSYPLVAIGGISLEKAEDLISAGADGIAVISDIINHPTPENRTINWLQKLKKIGQISLKNTSS